MIPLLPPLYILLSGFLPILQLLAEPVFHGVKPASSRSIKLQQGSWYAGVEKTEVQDGPVNDFSGTPCWAAEKKKKKRKREQLAEGKRLFVCKGIRDHITSPTAKVLGFHFKGCLQKWFTFYTAFKKCFEALIGHTICITLVWKFLLFV